MFTQFSRNWWWFALRGVAAIFFGIIALAWHGTTLHSFMLLFGSLALVDGLLAGFAALTNFARNKRWWILLHGLVSIFFAVLTLISTESAASILLYLVSAWALVTGILELVGARRLDDDVSNERLLHWSGIASIIFAVLVILLPKSGVLSLAGMFVVFAILFGLLTLAMSLNLRSLGKVIHLVHRSLAELSIAHNGSLIDYNQSGSFEQEGQKMKEMLMAIFNTAPQALRGLLIIKGLHRAGDITLYSTAVIAKETSGKVSIKQASERELNGAPLGLLTGIVVGTFGGPLGTAIGGLIGGLVGLIFDLAKAGISADFLEESSQVLAPGKTALLAEMDENSVASVDIRLAKLGGQVFWRQRSEFVEDQLIDELDTITSELSQP
jgi:uncharacterized membrane protein HdeD (DUF308 family)/uncharacterized membrane protein